MLERARDGTCGRTDGGESDCKRGSQGVFDGIDFSSWPMAAETCTRRCVHCARCSYVSFSTNWQDCSWFARCDVDALDREVNGFRTLFVKPLAVNNSSVSCDGFGYGRLATITRRQHSPVEHRHGQPLLLLGIFSFQSLSGALGRRQALRQLVVEATDARVARARFIMLGT